MNCLAEICDWERADRVAKQLHATISNDTSGRWMRAISPITALRLGLTPAQVKAVSEYHAAECARGIVPVRRDIVVDAPAPPRPARLRIGYLSRDLRDHAVGHLLANVFALHDRTQFEIYAFSYGVDDGSKYRKAIESGVDRFIDAHAMTDGELAAVIAAAGIHVLVDLAGHTTGNRMAVLARRPAPVQAHYLGYATTTGAAYIDHFISDQVATPPSMADAFSEKLVYLPSCFMVSDGADAPNFADRLAAFADATFAPDALVYCNFNNGSRITREDFSSWMDILRDVPGSVLWLQGANALMVGNLREEASSMRRRSRAVDLRSARADQARPSEAAEPRRSHARHNRLAHGPQQRERRTVGGRAGADGARPAFRQSRRREPRERRGPAGTRALRPCRYCARRCGSARTAPCSPRPNTARRSVRRRFSIPHARARSGVRRT